MDAKSILIIEDDANTQKLYLEKLSKEGYAVFLATTGKEGFFSAKDKKPNLIVLDIMLPGEMNGFDVLEQLKADSELKKIPVLVLTNLDTEEKVSKEIGAADYLVKANVSLDEVVGRIKKYLK